MYSTCLFCTQPLGKNEVLEHFSVGRRIAFDAVKGRLWVVCRNCARWNLTPFDERWEAIESAERLFRGTRLRVSTDNIGLARLSEGLELVRVGRPQRPEIAAWRYGDQFGRRRRRGLVTTGLIAAGGATVLTGGAALGTGVFVGAQAGRLAWQFVQYGLPMETVARLRLRPGALIHVQRRHLRKSSIRVGNDGSFGLDLELAELEAAWREAEEIGAIADSLLMPEWVEDAMRRLKGGR